MQQRKDKSGELFGTAALVAAALYLAYKAPGWIDESSWKSSFCYLAAVLLVTAGITLAVELIWSNNKEIK